MAENCHICSELASSTQYDVVTNSGFIDCNRCGKYTFGVDSGEVTISDIVKLDNTLKAALSQFVYLKNKATNKAVSITIDIIKYLTPIEPYEQAENLILYLGKNQKSPGENLVVEENSDKYKLFAEIGIAISHSTENLQYIIQNLEREGFLESPDKTISYRRLKLSLKGWKKYSELMHSISDSKVAFMAMKFPPAKGEDTNPCYAELQKIYELCKIEIAKLGYELKNPLLANPKAGNIDARLESEIRKAKFLVADLTHENQGAYWESGFAYGLGKRVFYICKKGTKLHFDTEHHSTIQWEVGSEEEAAEKLKDTIFNTLADIGTK